MRVESEKTLETFRGKGRCEFCERYCHQREAAHILAKGMGSGSRLDVRINLVSLGSTPNFACACHRLSHSNGIPTRDDLLGIVAKRERCNVVDIEPVLWSILRIPKNPRSDQIARELSELSGGERKLAERVLREIGL